MTKLRQHQGADASNPQHWLDVRIHDLLMKPEEELKFPPALLPQSANPQSLPEPIFTRRRLAEGEHLPENAYQRLNAIRGLRGWAVPYFKSLFHKGELRPIISHLFTGQNNLIIRTDGKLAPCFPMYSATYDWGWVGHPKFDVLQLDEMKKTCSTHCLSTCNRIIAHYYDARRATIWLLKQAARGFRGVTGSFD